MSVYMSVVVVECVCSAVWKLPSSYRRGSVPQGGCRRNGDSEIKWSGRRGIGKRQMFASMYRRRCKTHSISMWTTV